MTHEEAKCAFNDAAAAVNLCATILRPHVELFRQIEAERGDLENFGPVLAPARFLDRERRAVDAVVGPIFSKAREFVEAFDEELACAGAALEKVSS